MCLKRPAYSAALFLVLSLSTACGTPPTIHMNENVPPSFHFSGSRFAHHKYVAFFVVIELAPENEELPAYANTSVKNKTIWWIWPNDSANGQLQNLPVITYGQVPSGWIQKTPQDGEPPPLLEGRVYEAGGPQISVPHAFMRFTIRGGKAVRLPLYQDEFEHQEH
jgi:hypothetical protein